MHCLVSACQNEGHGWHMQTSPPTWASRCHRRLGGCHLASRLTGSPWWVPRASSPRLTLAPVGPPSTSLTRRSFLASTASLHLPMPSTTMCDCPHVPQTCFRPPRWRIPCATAAFWCTSFPRCGSHPLQTVLTNLVATPPPHAAVCGAHWWQDHPHLHSCLRRPLQWRRSPELHCRPGDIKLP
jgi:hypothetical protein